MACPQLSNISNYKYILLSIIFLLSIQSTFAKKCGTLEIDCNGSDTKCYSGPCAQFAPFFVGFNRLPFKPTPHPTITIISPRPTTNKYQSIPIPQPIPTPNKSPAPAPNPSPTLPTTTPEPSPHPTVYSSKSNPTPSSISIGINTSQTENENDAECAMIGEECTSAVPRTDRCCDVYPVQNIKCKFSRINTDGFKIGTCCVMKNKSGCSKDSDCCNKNRVCWDNRCLRAKDIHSSSQQSLSVSKNANFVDFVHDNNNDDDYYKPDTKHMTMSLSEVYIIVFIIFINIYGCIYCYNKYYGCRNDACYANEDIEFMLKRLEAETSSEYTTVSTLEPSV